MSKSYNHTRKRIARALLALLAAIAVLPTSALAVASGSSGPAVLARPTVPTGDPPADPPADPPVDPPADPPADNNVTVSKSEWDNIQRQNRENGAALKKLQDDAAAAQRKADEEAGNHQAIAAREKERADALAAEKTALEEERAQERRDARVARIAGTLKFKDPTDVNNVPAEIADDDAKTKKHLEALAKSKPYLVQDGEIPKTKDVTGEGSGSGDAAATATGVDRLANHYAKTGTAT